jgi:predicted short-subunit dehydrogenase-like oxidoreductase (DUF2520 family)
MDIAIIGTGRAGSSFAVALRDAGHRVQLVRHDELNRLAPSALILLCVPDDAIAHVADVLGERDGVLAHVAGSRGLEVFAGRERVGFLHPLAVLSSPEIGASRLRGALYSVGGDPLVDEVVASLRGRTIRIADDQRALYHAAASVAANHLVALMGHVAVLAGAAGLTLQDFLPLAREALTDVETSGVAAALTGPAARSDMATIDAHLAAIPEGERATYVAMANTAFELAEQRRLRASA